MTHRRPTPYFEFTPRIFKRIRHRLHRIKVLTPCLFNLHYWMEDDDYEKTLKFSCLYCKKSFQESPTRHSMEVGN